ncbi:MAG: hypothetical protein HY236_18225 [Acidobacteria bacterium]|nr:hypothetical protein [Acidobacteriota bacterium]
MQVEKARKAVGRTRSDVVRQALDSFFSQSFPVVPASAAELRAIRRGRREFRRGQYVSLQELLDDLGSTRSPVGGKRT